MKYIGTCTSMVAINVQYYYMPKNVPVAFVLKHQRFYISTNQICKSTKSSCGECEQSFMWMYHPPEFSFGPRFLLLMSKESLGLRLTSRHACCEVF